MIGNDYTNNDHSDKLFAFFLTMQSTIVMDQISNDRCMCPYDHTFLSCDSVTIYDVQCYFWESRTTCVISCLLLSEISRVKRNWNANKIMSCRMLSLMKTLTIDKKMKDVMPRCCHLLQLKQNWMTNRYMYFCRSYQLPIPMFNLQTLNPTHPSTTPPPLLAAFTDMDFV